MANNYNDALERAKQAIIDCGSNASRREMIYGIFPELREWGEVEAARVADEKIRVELTDYFRTSHCDTIRGIPMTKVLAWFEKQKEQKSASPQGGSSEIPNNQWSEEDKRMLDNIDESLFMYEAGQNDYAREQVERERKWLKSLPERFK